MTWAPFVPKLLVCFRGSGKELQAWGRRQDSKYHHGNEGAHEDTGEEPS